MNMNDPQSTCGEDDDGNAVMKDPRQLIASPDQKKLSSMVLGDGSFEDMMKERANMRREKEEHSLAQVTIQLTAAERALTMETQRRIQSTHAIQKSCTQKILDMEQNFERILNERSLRMEERLVNVQQKVEELTVRFEEEKDVVPKDMDGRGKELKDMLHNLQKELAEERSDRLNREGRILKQMDDHSSAIFGAIEKETTEREDISSGLQKRIENNERLRSQSEHELQSKIQREMSELKDMIERERLERKMGDDEIIGGLNGYVEKLQSSLSVISS
mmetsp:Transcript_12938/g.31522  ORF Transcript_12938/g.31522 Transcript_12938/m.31522 type:complete len:276 (-) Transcript_12938:1365-2192(-)